MATAVDRTHGGECTVQSWREFEDVWIKQRLNEVDGFLYLNDAYENQVREMLSVQNMLAPELERLHATLYSHLNAARLWRAIAEARDILKYIVMLIDGDASWWQMERSAPDARARVEHVKMLRNTLRSAYLSIIEHGSIDGC